MDYATFSSIWAAALQEDAAQGLPMAPSRNTYNKFKHLSPEEVLPALRSARASAVGDGGMPVPKLRPGTYLRKALAGIGWESKGGPAIQMPVALPFDSADKFQFLEFARTRDGKLETDTLSLPMQGEDADDTDDHQAASSRLWSGISSSFEGIVEASSSALRFERIVGDLLVISSKDGLPAARLVLPEVVEAIQQKLGCSASDDLVVIPFADDTVYATKSSSAMGCCMLGDMADRSVEHRQYLTSIPFRVSSINKSSTPQMLIAQGVTPVLWEFYPCWGRIPLQGITTPEGKVWFPVPGSSEQANTFVEAVKAGAKPSVIDHRSARVLADEGKQPEGCCAGCFKFGNFNQCARCKRACYCSRECQKGHWKLHKHQCGS